MAKRKGAGDTSEIGDESFDKEPTVAKPSTQTRKASDLRQPTKTKKSSVSKPGEKKVQAKQSGINQQRVQLTQASSGSSRSLRRDEYRPPTSYREKPAASARNKKKLGDRPPWVYSPKKVELDRTATERVQRNVKSRNESGMKNTKPSPTALDKKRLFDKPSRISPRKERVPLKPKDVGSNGNRTNPSPAATAMAKKKSPGKPRTIPVKKGPERRATESLTRRRIDGSASIKTKSRSVEHVKTEIDNEVATDFTDTARMDLRHDSSLQDQGDNEVSVQGDATIPTVGLSEDKERHDSSMISSQKESSQVTPTSTMSLSLEVGDDEVFQSSKTTEKADENRDLHEDAAGESSHKDAAPTVGPMSLAPEQRDDGEFESSVHVKPDTEKVDDENVHAPAVEDSSQKETLRVTPTVVITSATPVPSDDDNQPSVTVTEKSQTERTVDKEVHEEALEDSSQKAPEVTPTSLSLEPSDEVFQSSKTTKTSAVKAEDRDLHECDVGDSSKKDVRTVADSSTQTEIEDNPNEAMARNLVGSNDVTAIDKEKTEAARGGFSPFNIEKEVIDEYLEKALDKFDDWFDDHDDYVDENDGTFFIEDGREFAKMDARYLATQVSPTHPFKIEKYHPIYRSMIYDFFVQGSYKNALFLAKSICILGRKDLTSYLIASECELRIRRSPGDIFLFRREFHNAILDNPLITDGLIDAWDTLLIRNQMHVLSFIVNTTRYFRYRTDPKSKKDDLSRCFMLFMTLALRFQSLDLDRTGSVNVARYMINVLREIWLHMQNIRATGSEPQFLTHIIRPFCSKVLSGFCILVGYDDEALNLAQEGITYMDNDEVLTRTKYVLYGNLLETKAIAYHNLKRKYTEKGTHLALEAIQAYKLATDVPLKMKKEAALRVRSNLLRERRLSF